MSCLKVIRPAVEKRLQEHGLATIKDLLAIKNDDDKKKQAIRDVRGLAKKTLERMLLSCRMFMKVNVHRISTIPATSIHIKVYERTIGKKKCRYLQLSLPRRQSTI